MREFEKRFSDEGAYDDYGAGIQDGREQGWEAALEWIHSLYKKYDLEDWDRTACNIKEDIKGELNVK